jgi:hypothetical protein
LISSLVLLPIWLKKVPLLDRQGTPFRFSVPDLIAKQLHEIDLGAGGRIGVPEPVTNPETRDQYLMGKLQGISSTRQTGR